jgi:CubicO group peptidase (beta-lactamase class C family)
VVLDEPAGKWSHPPQFDDGAAGLVSTADDLLAFARMLLRGGARPAPDRGTQAGDSAPAGPPLAFFCALRIVTTAVIPSRPAGTRVTTAGSWYRQENS